MNINTLINISYIAEDIDTLNQEVIELNNLCRSIQDTLNKIQDLDVDPYSELYKLKYASGLLDNLLYRVNQLEMNKADK